MNTKVLINNHEEAIETLQDIATIQRQIDILNDYINGHQGEWWPELRRKWERKRNRRQVIVDELITRYEQKYGR